MPIGGGKEACASCMLLGWAIAVSVRYGSSVRDMEPPPRSHAVSAPSSGPLLGHLHQQAFCLRFLQLLIRSCGETGADVRRDAT